MNSIATALLMISSIQSTGRPAAAPPDPCGLLTKAEVEQVIGRLKSAPKAGSEGPVPWCGYQFANGRDEFEVWVFPADGMRRARLTAKQPVPISGLGEEAFLNRGAFGLDYLDLYIKKAAVTIKLAIKSSAGDEQKLRTLAARAVGRLP